MKLSERGSAGGQWPERAGIIESRSVVCPWRGEWENGRGDIVTCTLGGTGEQLRGVASYIPREVVDAARRRRGR